MKMQRLLQIIFVGVLAALIQSCETYPKSGPSALVGTWTNAVGTVWTIKENRTFDVDLNHDGRRDAWGKYSVNGDEVALIGTGGFMPKGCKGKGLYHFSRSEEDKLQFTLISDACKLRQKNVLLGWSRK